MNNSTLDAGIPVLTEIIVAPALAESGDARSVDPSPGTASADAPMAMEPAISDSGTDEESQQLEREISERVLHQLLERIDFVLEQRVRDSLADVLQLAMTGLTNELRQGLQEMLEDVVTRAVSQELSKLQATKK